jgi:hypothetical protein
MTLLSWAKEITQMAMTLSLQNIASSDVLWIRKNKLMAKLAGTNPNNYSTPIGKIVSIEGDDVKVKFFQHHDKKYVQHLSDAPF